MSASSGTPRTAPWPQKLTPDTGGLLEPPKPMSSAANTLLADGWTPDLRERVPAAVLRHACVVICYGRPGKQIHV